MGLDLRGLLIFADNNNRLRVWVALAQRGVFNPDIVA